MDILDLLTLLAQISPDVGENLQDYYDAAGVKAAELYVFTNFDFPKTSAPVDPEVDPVSALLAEWGQRALENDFNGDGVVDMQDLLILLKKIGVKHKIKPFIIAPVDHTDGVNEITPVDELIAEWGYECPENDFNGDGVVDMQDLLILLEEMGAAAAISSSSS